MIFLLGMVIVVVTVFAYYTLMAWPATFLAWLHVPSWLILGILGGILAWCLADD